MKVILIIFVLLAFVLFSSSSIGARELAQTDAVYAKDPKKNDPNPNRPSVPFGAICGRPSDPQYAKCITSRSKPGPKCKGKSAYKRCKPPQTP
ncbi:hypothetical protein CJ030_MR6G013207 [Morella rubra]|uniref:Uncharacterized protein n=1 Tax=Morella rubra TaxID=262757 RepID=A0A6A1VFX4_9ROSI|nr:hypothetical protein CJ030_MR6G013207 [Morella rubra]